MKINNISVTETEWNNVLSMLSRALSKNARLSVSVAYGPGWRDISASYETIDLSYLMVDCQSGLEFIFKIQDIIL